MGKSNAAKQNKQITTSMRGGKGPRTVTVGLTPDRIRLHLKYSDQMQVANSTGVTALQSFRLNSLEDPDYTGTGHQPQYYDQWFGAVEGNGLYHKYIVRAVEYKVTIGNERSHPTNVVIFPTPHGNVPDTSDEFLSMCEAPWAQCGQLAGSNSGKCQRTFTGKIVISALEGVQVLDPSSYQATYGSNPGFVPLLNIAAQRIDGSSNVEVSVAISLRYIVDGFDRIYRPVTN